jgi:hypothetical protein
MLGKWIGAGDGDAMARIFGDRFLKTDASTINKIVMVRSSHHHKLRRL